MSLDNKLKQVTLSVALHHVIKNKQKSKERTCRNIIELSKELSGEVFDENTLKLIYDELLEKINQVTEEELKEWVINTFRLY